MTASPDDGGLAMAYAGSWLAATADRIATASAPGGLDALLAGYFLGGTSVPGLAQDGSGLSAKWLEENRDRLGQAPVIATIGYELGDAPPGVQATARSMLATGLQRLMARNPFADRLTFVRNPAQVVGIGLAAHAMAADLPRFSDWLAETLGDERLQPSGRFQALLYEHVRALLTGRMASVEIRQGDDVTVLALRYWMSLAGTARPPDADERHELQQRVVSEALRTNPGQLSVPRAALTYQAVTTILDASISQAVLSQSHLVTILTRFEPAMHRWRWDDSKLQHPIRWEISSEREVQDILWLMLRPVFDDLVDEETLAKMGHASYRADFGIPSLGVLIEVKYVRKSSDFKEIEQQVMVDSVAYLPGTTAYKEIVVFIYDASASVQEHSTAAAALRRLESVSDVVIVSRPSQLA